MLVRLQLNLWNTQLAVCQDPHPSRQCHVIALRGQQCAAALQQETMCLQHLLAVGHVRDTMQSDQGALQKDPDVAGACNAHGNVDILKWQLMPARHGNPPYSLPNCFVWPSISQQ